MVYTTSNLILFSSMQNPNLSVQQRLNLAMQLLHAGQFEQALSHFLILKKLGLTDFRLSRAIGSAYERLLKDNDAKHYFAESLALNPKQPDLHFALANIALRAGEFSNAIKQYKQCLAFDNQNIRVWLKLGQTYLQTEQLDLAAQAFTRCEAIQPGDVDARLGQSRVLQKRKLFEQAEKILTDLAKQQPQNTKILSELAWLEKLVGNYTRAVTLFQKRLNIDANNPECYEDLALANLDVGNTNDALDILKVGIQKAPEHRNLNKLLSSLKFEMNEEDHLAHYRQKPVEEMTNELLADYISGLIKNDQTELAETLVDRLNSFSTKRHVAEQMQLALWEKSKKYEPIVGYFQNLHRQNIHISAPQNERLIKAYLATGNYQLANQLIDRMLQDSPNDQFLWALKSTTLRLLNNPEYESLCDYQSMVFSQQILLPSNHQSLEQFNHQLRETLVKIHTSRRNPLEQSLRNGTQTTGNLFSRQLPIIQELKSALKNTIDAMLTGLPKNTSHPFYKHAGKDFDFSANWSVRLTNQGFHISHVHPKGWLSSAYYVQLPDSISDDDKKGWLHFGKPGIDLPMQLNAQKWVKPEVGKLVLFPSYFWHGTEPFTDSKERMSVAFDLLPTKQ